MSSKTSTARQSSTSSEHPAAFWSTQSYTLQEISEKFKFPQIIQSDDDTAMSWERQHVPVDLTQPLLLYSKGCSTKLLAKNIVRSGTTNGYVERNNSVVIPEDYPGMFAPLQGSTAAEIKSHQTIDSVVSSNISAFTNSTPLIAFTTQTNGGQSKFQRHDYPPGSIFTLHKLVSGSVRVKTGRERLHVRRKPPVNVNYVQCRDSQGTTILVPIAQEGEFLEIGGSTRKFGVVSTRIKDLVHSRRLPFVARILYGSAPRLTQFSGILSFESIFEERSMIACSIAKSGLILTELPLTVPCRFQIALNIDVLLGRSVVKHAVVLCRKEAEGYKCDLKLPLKFLYTKTITNGNHESDENHNDAQANGHRSFVYV